MCRFGRIAQTAKEITPRVRVSPKAREMAKVRTIPQVQTREEAGGNSVTNKAIVIEEVPQSQSAS